MSCESFGTNENEYVLNGCIWDDNGPRDFKYSSCTDAMDEDICVDSECIWAKPKKSKKEICFACHLFLSEEACTKAMYAYASDT